MRIFVTFLIIAALFLFLYYTYIVSELNAIEYNVKIKNIDFSNFLLADYSGKGSEILTQIEIDLNNNGNASLSVKDLYIEVYYQGILLAKTSPNPLNASRITINKKSTTAINQEFIVYVNNNSLALLKNLKTAILEFRIKVNWFGFKISQTVTSKI